jgi:hypothetical protein
MSYNASRLSWLAATFLERVQQHHGIATFLVTLHREKKSRQACWNSGLGITSLQHGISVSMTKLNEHFDPYLICRSQALVLSPNQVVQHIFLWDEDRIKPRRRKVFSHHTPFFNHAMLPRRQGLMKETSGND